MAEKATIADLTEPGIRELRLALVCGPPSKSGVADPGADRSRVARKELVPECIPAFEAILLEETGDLDKAQDLIGDVRKTIADLEDEAASTSSAASGGAAAGAG